MHLGQHCAENGQPSTAIANLSLLTLVSRSVRINSTDEVGDVKGKSKVQRRGLRRDSEQKLATYVYSAQHIRHALVPQFYNTPDSILMTGHLMYAG